MKYRIGTIINRLNLLIAIILTIVPARVASTLSIYSIDVPTFAEEFGTVFPVIPLQNFLALIWFTINIIFFNKKINGNISIFIIFAAITILSSLFIIIQRDIFYVDNIILLVNTSAIYLAWILVDEEKRNSGIIIALILSCVITFISILNDVRLSERVNLPGFEITTAGYAVGIMILMSIAHTSKINYLITAVIGLTMLILIGSRFPVLALFITIFFMVLEKQKFRTKVIYSIIMVLSGFIIIIFIFNARGDFDGYTFYNFLNEIIDAIENYDPQNYINNEIISKINVIYGRVIAVLSGIDILVNTFPLPLGSDWLIQSELIERGYPSHTHNTIIQLSIKFGMLFFILLISILIIMKNNIKYNHKNKYVFIFLLIGSFLDYLLFVPNMCAIFLILGSSKYIQKNEYKN